MKFLAHVEFHSYNLYNTDVADVTEKKNWIVQNFIMSLWLLQWPVYVTPRFSKYAETESRRESATYIREENTLRIHA